MASVISNQSMSLRAAAIVFTFIVPLMTYPILAKLEEKTRSRKTIELDKTLGTHEEIDYLSP